MHRSVIRVAGSAALAVRSAALAARTLSSQAGAFVTLQEQQPGEDSDVLATGTRCGCDVRAVLRATGVFALALSREDGKNSFSKAMLAQVKRKNR